MILCAECDKENPDGSDDCKHCGFPLAHFTAYSRMRKAAHKQEAADKAERERAEIEKKKTEKPPKSKSFFGGLGKRKEAK